MYNECAALELKIIRGMLGDCLAEYFSKKSDVEINEHVNSSKPPSNCSMKRKTPDKFDVDDEDEFNLAKKTKEQRVNVRCELDHFLDDDALLDDSKFDVLDYWKKDLKVSNVIEDC